MGKRMPTVMSSREPTCISQIGIKKLFCIFKPTIPLLLNSPHSGLVKLGPRIPRSLEKGAKELHIFTCNQDHVYNSQMGIKYDFIFANEEFFFSKITFIRG